MNPNSDAIFDRISTSASFGDGCCFTPQVYIQTGGPNSSWMTSSNWVLSSLPDTDTTARGFFDLTPLNVPSPMINKSGNQAAYSLSSWHVITPDYAGADINLQAEIHDLDANGNPDETAPFVELFSYRLTGASHASALVSPHAAVSLPELCDSINIANETVPVRMTIWYFSADVGDYVIGWQDWVTFDLLDFPIM